MAIRNSALHSLSQLAQTISSLSSEEYVMPLDILHHNSIGKHVRHVVEFFECLDLGNTFLVVDYDDRQRNLRLENDIAFALQRIAELQVEIPMYEEKMLTLLANYGNGPQKVMTTTFRELVYNIEHCVHHLAIIKIGVEAQFPHVNLSENLGVAWSTQQFQKAS
jgi:hypothetical protein